MAVALYVEMLISVGADGGPGKVCIDKITNSTDSSTEIYYHVP